MRLFSRSALILASALALPLAITACDTIEKPKPAKCPEVRVLEDLGSVTRYKPGPGRDITDIILEAEFTRVAGECNVDDENIHAELFVEMNASQGPAERNETAEVNLIMAISDVDRNIISRRTMPIEFTFRGNNTRIFYLERFIADIPRTQGDASDDYIIYLGYELTREELNFNRTQN